MIKPLQTIAKWIGSKQSNESPIRNKSIRSSSSASKLQQLFSSRSKSITKNNNKQQTNKQKKIGSSLATVGAATSYLIDYGNNSSIGNNSSHHLSSESGIESSSDNDFEIIGPETADHQSTIEESLSNVFAERVTDTQTTAANNNGQSKTSSSSNRQSPTTTNIKTIGNDLNTEDDSSESDVFNFLCSIETSPNNERNSIFSTFTSGVSSNGDCRTSESSNSDDDLEDLQNQFSSNLLQGYLHSFLSEELNDDHDLTGTSNESSTNSYLNDDFFSSATAALEAISANDNEFEEFMFEMRSEANRLMTFNLSTWPVDFISTGELARCGFFYLGRLDHVQCAFCNLKLISWEAGDSPLQEHIKHNANCDFLCGRSVQNIPIDSELTNAMLQSVQNIRGVDEVPPLMRSIVIRHHLTPTYSSDSSSSLITIAEQGAEMAIQSARRSTFPADWSKRTLVDADEISKAGFYFTGPNDHVVCFSCKGTLRQWEDTDIPWIEHAKYFPRCEYLRLCKGEDFIEKHKILGKNERVAESKKNTASDEKTSQILEATTSEVATSQPPTNTETPCTEDVKKEEDKVIPEKSEEIQKEKETLSNSSSSAADVLQCKICYEETIGVVFIPCGHFFCCAGCSINLTICSICRVPIKERIRAII